MAQNNDLVVEVEVLEEETTREEMAQNNDWVATVKDKLRRLDSIQTSKKQHWDKRSIHKVPKSVRDLNVNAYKPQHVSFGPYHHGKEELKHMEEHKERALLHFLKRSYKPPEDHMESLAGVAQNLKDSYESLDLGWQRDTGKFLQMMIVDGCFMIEVLRNFTETVSNNYTDNDPIFSNHGMLHFVPYIKRDMLMLENQLPMLLLTTLFDEEIKRDEEFLNKLILKFFFGNNRFPNTPTPRMGKCLHLLELYRKILLWAPHRGISGRKKKSWWRWILISCKTTYDGPGAGNEFRIRSALEMTEVGISFRKSKTQSLEDISLDRGELRLPTIRVDDTTESMFLNIIAFERFQVGVGNAVTSYLFFMSSIIDTDKDVRFLQDKGIIRNALGKDIAVSKLFNSISKDTTLDPDSSLEDVYELFHNYYKHWWNRWRANAKAKQTYLRNPWAIISVIVAFVLFVLTMLQTVYTILSYYHPKSTS